MRRGREKDLEKYIDVRIGQLKQDMKNAHDDYDKQWYNRIIQELCWVKSQQHNCYLDEVEHWKDTYTYLPQARKRMRDQMEIVEWGPRWKVLFPSGGSKKFSSKEQAEAFVAASAGGAAVTPGFRTLIIDTPAVAEADDPELLEESLEDFLEEEEAENE